MSDDGIPCAIAGATGYIGQHFARLLADHPTFDRPILVARGGRRQLSDAWMISEDAPPEYRDDPLLARTPAQLARSGVRALFSALPSGTAGPFETECARRGIRVYTNASDHRMDPRVALLVPEVNPEHLTLARPGRSRPAPIVANPNCTTTGLVLALAPVVPLLRPRSVHVTSYQALSGAGVPGVPSLAIADNVVPFIAGEEEKVAAESARILGSVGSGRVASWPPRVLAQCARVGVRDGHLEAVTVEASATPRRAQIESAFLEFDPLRGDDLPTAPHPPVILRPEADRPQPLRDRLAGGPGRTEGMAVVVGRLRWDAPFLRFFLLVHNAIRGGAGGSVLNAEFVEMRVRQALR